jgi:hypothetical protein
MAANRFGIDVAQLYKEKEQIRGSRVNNMAELQLSETENKIAQRPAINDLRNQASEGDQEAQKKLLRMDPVEGAAFIKAINSMDDRQKEEAKGHLEAIGSTANTIINAKPERQAALYGALYNSMPPEVQAKMPPQLDLDFLEVEMAKAGTKLSVLDNPTVLQVGDEDVVYQEGQEIARANSFVKPSQTGGGSNELKSGDENLMYRQAAELMGGMFDAAGNLQALDPQTRTKAQAIATEASKLFKQGGITRTQAVSQAAKLFGLELPAQSVDNDPLGIRAQ